MLMNVATQTLFNTNPVVFTIGDTNGNASGRDNLSIKEFFRPGGFQSGTNSPLYCMEYR